MDLGLAGRRAVVTGGSKGLGKAIAAELLAEGAQVVICSRNDAELEEAAAELRKPGGTVFAFRCDVTDPDEVTAFINQAESALGGIDILVNSVNIGFVTTPQWENIHRRRAPDTPAEEFFGQLAAAEVPLGRFGRADEVSGIVAFLASDRASYITGASVDVAGGMGKYL